MYTSRGQVEVDEATNKRLKRLIDKRVLVIMICTYFLQALEKGTMSFSSIMGIKTDAHLEDGQKYSWLTTCIYIAVLIVEYPTNWIIQRVPRRKVPRNQHLSLGHRSGHACRLSQLCRSGHSPDFPGYLRGMLPAHLRATIIHVVQARRASSDGHILVHDERCAADRRRSTSVLLHSDRR